MALNSHCALESNGKLKEKNTDALTKRLSDCILLALGWSLDVGIFESSQDGSSMQPGLRITGMGHELILI